MISRNKSFLCLPFLTALITSTETFAATTVVITDTAQHRCYSNNRAISCPEPGQPFYGQDAQYRSAEPAYRDNNNGTVSDLNTGLMWSKAVSPRKLSLQEALSEAQVMSLAGYSDWRVPNIKELYSLIDFRGYSGFSERRVPGQQEGIPYNAVPFINTDYFDFLYGSAEERYIDAQWLSSTKYVSTTMDGDETLFGVNFADGRLKGYGYRHPKARQDTKKFYVRYVRGHTAYGQNQFQDNGDGTVSDMTTGLVWAKADSGQAMNWQAALNWAENLTLGGHQDWRLPNAKELQYLVDYTRSPDSSQSASIDPIFHSSPINNERGERDYPAYWTSTTHLDGPTPGTQAVYIAFGRAIGELNGNIIDAHGAGAQRSDPKTGSARLGSGPQGDAVRINNFIRVVRGGGVKADNTAVKTRSGRYPYNIDQSHFKAVADERPENKHPRPAKNPGAPSGQQPPRMPPDFGSRFIRRLDRDGDAQVSRQEFDGPPSRFDVHDNNGDGYLTQDEAPPPPPRHHTRQRDVRY